MRILIAFLALFISACSTYRTVPDVAVQKIPPEQLEKALATVNKTSHVLDVLSKVYTAAEPLCTKKGPQLPFFLYQNPNVKDDMLRAAYSKAGWSGQPVWVSWQDDGLVNQGKQVTNVADIQIQQGEAGKAYWSAFKQAKEKGSVVIGFSDGTTSTVKPFQACAGVIVVEPLTEKLEPYNLGTGVEVIPLDFLAAAPDDDIMLFLLARSVYLTSAQGQESLNSGMAKGAAVNGILTGLTLGLSRLIVDTKDTFAVIARRNQMAAADAFALRVALNAGVNGDKVIAFAKSVKGSPRPDLKFDDERLLAMQSVLTLTSAQK